MLKPTPRALTLSLSLVAAAGLAVLALGQKPSPPELPPVPAAPFAVVTADPGVRKIAAANTTFGFQMLRRLTKDAPEGNVFFSPLSISSALTMTLGGADGTTQRAMASALGLAGLTREQVGRANGLLLPSLENPDPKVKLSVANALWAGAGTTFAPDFQERSRRFYGARTQTLDFGSPDAAGTINDWVAEHTQGKITQIVTPPDIARSPAVLTNAVYFHGLWQTPFEKSATQDGPFTLPDGGKKTLPLMSQVGSYSYLQTAQFQAVRLPYGAGRMSFYVFLPKPSHGVDQFVTELKANAWAGWIGKMKPTRLSLILPRFKADYQATLNKPLIGMGMGPAFRDGADFAPMGLRGAYIGAVLHKAVLEVDEEGTVAAAATAVTMAGSAISPPLTEMRVDRPFFCAIRDDATGTLLFAGVIRDPE